MSAVTGRQQLEHFLVGSEQVGRIAPQAVPQESEFLAFGVLNDKNTNLIPNKNELEAFRRCGMRTNQEVFGE